MKCYIKGQYVRQMKTNKAEGWAVVRLPLGRPIFPVGVPVWAPAWLLISASC